jgi:hypothetical protein
MDRYFLGMELTPCAVLDDMVRPPNCLRWRPCRARRELAVLRNFRRMSRVRPSDFAISSTRISSGTSLGRVDRANRGRVVARPCWGSVTGPKLYGQDWRRLKNAAPIVGLTRRITSACPVPAEVSSTCHVVLVVSTHHHRRAQLAVDGGCAAVGRPCGVSSLRVHMSFTGCLIACDTAPPRLPAHGCRRPKGRRP